MRHLTTPYLQCHFRWYRDCDYHVGTDPRICCAPELTMSIGLGATITNAINRVPLASACKVALEYETRFWEHLDNPIFGGLTETDIPGIGWTTYPSYCLNCTGPATLLASYTTDVAWGDIWVSVSEAEHVQYVVDAMAEIHGEVAYDQYTGNYRRKCWREDEFANGGWAQPTIGQHQLYIPEYFKTHKNVSLSIWRHTYALKTSILICLQIIFVGEQTSYTHSWVASALESGVRGAVQMLLGKKLAKSDVLCCNID